MKKLLVLIPILLMGCGQRYVEKYSQKEAQTAYAVSDSIKAGRIDEAKSYSENLNTIIPVPKRRLVVHEVIENGQRVIILPDSLKGKVVLVGSSEFKELEKQKLINRQLENDLKTVKQNAKDASEQRIKDQDVQDKLLKSYNQTQIKLASAEGYKKTFWAMVFIIGLVGVAYLVTKIGGFALL